MSSRPNLTLSTLDPSLDSLELLSWRLSSLRNTRPTSRLETGAQHISWSQGCSISRSPLRRPWQSARAFFISSLSIFFSDVVHYSGTECSFYLLSHTSVPLEFRPWQLSQLQEDNSWRPIAYLSKVMNKTERNYEIYSWELLAIIEGLKQ